MPKPDEELRNLGQFLQHLEDGQFCIDAQQQLHELNLAMLKQAEQGGRARGRLSLEFSFSVEQGGTVQIESRVTTKAPEPVRARSVTWMSKSGHLTKNNPRQTLLGLREVPPPAPAREVDEDVDANSPRSV